MDDPQESLEFRDPSQWRAWLEAHHASVSAAWLIIYKKAYHDQGLSLDQAVEEALCFGWIDGGMKSLDERRYALRFSPRTSTSIWSISNIRRVERLVAEGRMTPAGLAKVAEAKESGAWEEAIRREQVDVIPEELEVVLQDHPGAVDAYHALPASRKKQLIYWLQTAKREQTRQRRIQAIVDEVLGR